MAVTIANDKLDEVTFFSAEKILECSHQYHEFLKKYKLFVRPDDAPGAKHRLIVLVSSEKTLILA